jgi:hypothetical protein
MPRTLTVIALSLSISSCVFYPKQTEYYDAECDIKFRKLVLESKEMKDACLRPKSDDPDGNTCLMAVLGTTALSAIVSGSLVVAGNTVYWLEKEARCIAKTNSNIGN